MNEEVDVRVDCIGLYTLRGPLTVATEQYVWSIGRVGCIMLSLTALRQKSAREFLCLTV